MKPQNGCDVEDLSVGRGPETAKTISDADLVLLDKVGIDGEAILMPASRKKREAAGK
ncbi:MAG TPA: hypothetical protein PK752_24650 [Accumulibacter sp.]|uniref:hypothetical protein n=1 Tax=Accumulibacter sp. TaxID=2053492 RepID=UPI002C1B8C16|nr:hypothetical protein [Accumulibacter sp.]HRD91420.1 hypothetical protein [Accumulibacter sp.]